MRTVRRIPLPLAALLTVLVWHAAPAAAQPAGGTLSGTLQTTWGDTFDPRRPALEIPTLVGDDGRVHRLEVPAAALARYGGLRALEGRRVTVRVDDGAPAARSTGRPLAVRALERIEGASRFDVRRLLAPTSAAAGGPGAPRWSVAEAPTVRRMPFATLLCKYADRAEEPAPRGHYRTLLSETFPNVGHFWAHNSGGRLSMAGSDAFGWYTLPHPESYYNRPGELFVDDWKLAQDCMAAADADVRFPDFEGINIQTNGGIGMYAGFATSVASTRDGVARSYRMTVLKGDASPKVLAHEIGHTFGLPHSAGEYGREYDSKWDVMSSGWWTPPGAPPGLDAAMGVHTIAAYQAWLGWISDHQRFVAPAGTSTVTLDPLRGAGAGANAQVAVVATPDGGVYTVEARRRAGYDVGVPADAVIIHRVPGAVGRAFLVDADGNGDPWDEGAVWRVGEVFRDRGRGVEIAVDRAVGDGFQVTLRTPGVDSARLVPAAHRRTVAFGTTGAVLDSAFLEVDGPNAAAVRWEVRAAGDAHVTTPSGTGSAWLRWRRAPDGLPPGQYLEFLDLRVTGAIVRKLELIDTLVVTPHAGLVAGFARPVRTDTLVAGLARADDLFSGGAFADLRLAGPGADRAAWTVARRPPWLTLDASSGTGDAALMGTRSAQGMTPGTHVDTLRVTVTGAERPATLVHRLVVRPAPSIVPARAATAGPVPQGAESALDSVWVSVRGDDAASMALRVGAERPVVAVDTLRIGSGWVRFRRSGVARAPGAHLGRLRLRLPHDDLGALDVVLSDTAHVTAAATGLALRRAPGVDTVQVGEWRVVTAQVEPRGEGSTVHTWRPVWTPARTTMLDWLPPDLGQQRTEQPGPGTLRWVRNLASRRPGLHVDTIGVSFVRGPALGTTLLDSVYVVSGPRTPLVIASVPARPPATVGTPYVDLLQAAGGAGAHAWSVMQGALPPGLTLDATNGTISGTPTAAGAHAFTIAVRAGDEVAQLAATLTVGAGPLAVASAAERPGAVMGAAYADTLRATGAGPGLRWWLAAGALPPGVALDSVTGRLAGVAEAVGTFRFTVRAESEARSATGELRIVVTRPALDATAVLDQLLGTGTLPADHRRFLDLLGNRNDRVDVGDVAAWLDAAPPSAAASPAVAELRRLVTPERPRSATPPRMAPGAAPDSTSAAPSHRSAPATP